MKVPWTICVLLLIVPSSLGMHLGLRRYVRSKISGGIKDALNFGSTGSFKIIPNKVFSIAFGNSNVQSSLNGTEIVEKDSNSSEIFRDDDKLEIKHTPTNVTQDLSLRSSEANSTLPEDEEENNINGDDAVAPKREKGRLGGLGREIVRGGADLVINGVTTVGDGLNKVGQKIGIFMNKNSGGLDNDTRLFGNILGFQDRIAAIFPGTLWCGSGNRARAESDLGLFHSADACCRDHDNCHDNMQASETKHGLYNTGLFTRSHCDCDKKFYKCLKNAKNLVALKIGFTYFTILGPQCFNEDYPITGCLKWAKTQSNLDKCVLYEQNRSATPVYQWFDNDIFTL